MDRWTAVTVAMLCGLLLAQCGWLLSLSSRVADHRDRIDALEDDRSGAAPAVSSRCRTAAPAVSVPVYAYERSREEVVTATIRVRSRPDGLYFDLGAVVPTSQLAQSVRHAWWAAHDTRSPSAGAVVTLETPADWERVGGGSAALPIAGAIAAASSCATLNESVAATGGLTADGETVSVRYVRAKATHARAAGVETMLVPAGQAVEVAGIDVIGVDSFESARTRLLETNSSCSSRAIPARRRT